MKRAEPLRKAGLAHLRVRRLRILLLSALLLLAAGPLYMWSAINLSGELVLAQLAPAEGVLRGFDFGPVYLRQGVPGRYFIEAQVPQTESDYWHTSFEVLDSTRTPVFQQDELRFIGEFRFKPGQQDRCIKSFTLDRGDGYYYFRFTALNGTYAATGVQPPVVSFAIRQGVLDGQALWIPLAASMLLGLLLLLWAWRLICKLGAPAAGSRPDLRGRSQVTERRPL